MLSLLGSLVERAGRIPTPELEHGDSLTILIEMRGSESAFDSLSETPTMPLPEPPAAAAEADRAPPAAVTPEPEPTQDPQPKRDWHAIAKSAATSSVEDYYRNQDSRAALWRETHSIMFEPTGDFIAQEEAPVLRGFRFKPEIHVFGLGVTIGSCFIGLPLVGVPVEQRTIAINLFVCAEESDKPLG